MKLRHLPRAAAAWWLFLTCPLVPTAPAQPPSGLSRSEVLRLAEARFQDGDLLEAAGLYRRALGGAEGNTRIRCYDRLVAIYARLGRVERAVHFGLRYRKLLKKGSKLLRLRDLEVHLGECYLALGHYATAEAYLERVLADGGKLPPLPALKRLIALTHLARSAEQRRDRERAGRFWERVERLAVEQLGAVRPALTLVERVEVTWKLADSYRFRGENDRAIERLTPLLPVHDQLRDPAGKRDTLRRLAGHHANRGEHAVAEKSLRQALRLRGSDEDAMLRGDLADELGEAVAGQGRAAEAEGWFKESASAYKAVLEPSAGADVSHVISAFWKLQKLYQKTSQYRRALELAESAEAKTDLWAGQALTEPKFKSEQGTLQVILGAFKSARARLGEAVAGLERQDTLNLIDLPRALNNLALVEQATGDLGRAEELANKCLALHRKHRLPDSLILAEVHNLLGTCAAERGRYTVAIRRFGAGIGLCERLGRTADPPRSNLLLNVALLHKSQGDTEEAAAACREALKVYRRFAPADALGFAAFAAAEASLALGRRDLAAAQAQVPRILELCRKHDVKAGPLLVTAYHCEGLYRLSRREADAAEAAWRKALALQEQEQTALLLPRTLNYLGLVEELRGRADRAEALYLRARGLQRKNTRAFPVTHFITLWRLAGLLDARGQGARARGLLEEGVDVIEEARLQAYGDDQLRASYFAQFEPGFDRLVEWAVRDGDVEAAFVATTRSRSRTLLDQLQHAGLDPRKALKGAEGEALRRREAELRQHIAGLRARAQLIPIEAAGKEGPRQLMAALDEAQKEYAGVWRRILRANPLADRLSARDGARTLTPEVRGRLLGPKTLLLVYHVGRQHSYVLLLGGRGVKPTALELKAPPGLAATVARPAPPSARFVLDSRRVRLRQRPAEAPRPVSLPPKEGAAVPLARDLAGALVDCYCEEISDPAFTPTRTIRLKRRDPARAVPAQGPELLGDLLLPAALRDRLRELAPERLVVVPDGPLHKLPLEAVLLRGGERPVYACDELPPIVYAPTASALAVFAERPRPQGPLSLLTVSNPAYPKNVGGKGAPAPRQVLGFKGQLPRLHYTARESEGIQSFFEKSQVQELTGAEATERNVVAAVKGKRMIHIAAHGFADDDFGNLFGALALMPPPPGKERSNDDGFLSLHEIYLLPLQGCELAVLSACVTNVGPQRPLEAGVTLASGFLAAGARRVVASHWSVADKSTALLMEAFFEEVTKAARRGQEADYARALHKARERVRSRPGWSAPYYWAPFVLIGPAR